MKKSILFLLVLLPCTAGLTASPSPALLEMFRLQYPQASQVIWSDHHEGYSVYCKLPGEVTVRLFYDRTETLVSCMKHYAGALLPPMVLQQVKRDHRKKSIITVLECSNRQGLNYFILMEDDKRIYRYRYLQDASYYELTESFKKQPPPAETP